MKKFIFSMLLASLISSVKAYADSPEDYYSESTSYDVYFYQEAVSAGEPEENPIVDPLREGRKPARRIEGTISLANGIEIHGVDVSEIYSFEIYDENDGCLGVFSDPEGFVQAIFLYNESIKIRLITAEFIYRGNLLT